MNTRAFTLAIIIAVFAMVMVSTYIDDQMASIQKKYGDMKQVVVAKKAIKELELIDDSKVTTLAVPKSFVAPGAFKDIKDVDNTMATVPILAGEQITKPRVTYPGASTGLSRQVTDGKRAFAITISDDSAASKLIKPGDRVDIITAMDYTSGRKDMQKAMTALQNVYVLATGKSVTNSIPLYGVKTSKAIKAMKVATYTQYNTITLELTPYQVQKLTFILNFAGKRPYLSLRNNNDTEIVNIKPTRIFDVLGDEAAEAKAYFAEQYAKKK